MMPVLKLRGYLLYSGPKFTRDQGNSFSNCEILGTSLKCMFMMAGPGIKENYIIPRDVQEVDVTPTLCHLYGMEMPNGVEGGVLYQALNKNFLTDGNLIKEALSVITLYCIASSVLH